LKGHQKMRAIDLPITVENQKHIHFNENIIKVKLIKRNIKN